MHARKASKRSPGGLPCAVLAQAASFCRAPGSSLSSAMNAGGLRRYCSARSCQPRVSAPQRSSASEHNSSASGSPARVSSASVLRGLGG
jgi:hypothetical protein